MKLTRTTLTLFFLAAVVLVLLAPVSAATGASDNASKPWISATATPSIVKVGSPVTISGTATGTNASSSVQIWIFAGNYANVTSAPVNSTGYYSKTYNTSGLPPAYYYVFVQSPGADTSFNINLKGYSGEVVNTATGKVIFNFTGTGSVTDTAAATALSAAFNTQGSDDVYAKTGFQLVSLTAASNATSQIKDVQATLLAGNASPVPAETKPPVSTAAKTPVMTATPAKTTVPVTSQTTKTPLSGFTAFAGLSVAAIAFCLARKE
jgi:hypothetical protein